MTKKGMSLEIGGGAGELSFRNILVRIAARVYAVMERAYFKELESRAENAEAQVSTARDETEQRKMKTMNTIIKKLAMTMMMISGAFATTASPLALPVKVTAEKVGAHVGGRVAGEVAVRGGTALAAATAKHEAAKATARATAVKVVEKATPGKILAAGAGTALVVGTHEVTDGVQAMGTSVGKAVEDNPEAAVSLGREVLSLPKMAIGIVTAFVMAVFAWMLWPFLTLTRNWIQLVAARKARMLEAMSVTEDVRQDTGNLGAPGFARVRLVWITAFLLLSALGVWRLVVDGDRLCGGTLRTARMMFQNEETMSRTAGRAKVVDGFRKEYEDEVVRIHREFLAKVDSTASAEFGHVRAGISDVVKQFGTMSRCAELVKTVALDKCRGGNRTEKSIRQDLEVSYYSGLYAARDSMAECLQDLASNLENAHRSFAGRLKEELALGELPGDGEYKAMLEECGERIEKSKHDLAVGQIAAGSSVIIEAICIRQTVSVVSSLLGKVAARQVGTMAVGATAAVADGPLPIMDILSGIAVLGSTAWTGWEVYQATEVLPAKLSETLMDVTEDCERQCRDEACKIGASLVAQFL